MTHGEFIVNEEPVIRRTWDTQRTAQHIQSLPIWRGAVQVRQLFGGLQNRTYFVTDADGRKYVARSGVDQFRTRQTSVVACIIAAARLGIGPALRYTEPCLTITDFIPGPQIALSEQKDPRIVERMVDVVRILHGGASALPGSISYWAPFDTIRRFLREMETGFQSTGFAPSEFIDSVPFFRDVTARLERAVEPFIPTLTHNDLGFANMMFATPEKSAIWLIDWDGGAYGNPLWDIAEMCMWAGGGEELDRLILRRYCGAVSESRMKELLHQHNALKLASSLRLITECATAVMDPYYFLTPEEVAESMKVNFPNLGLRMTGLVDLLRPSFDALWHSTGHNYT